MIVSGFEFLTGKIEWGNMRWGGERAAGG